MEPKIEKKDGVVIIHPPEPPIPINKIDNLSAKLDKLEWQNFFLSVFTSILAALLFCLFILVFHLAKWI